MNMVMRPGDILLLPTKYSEVYATIAGVLGVNITKFLPVLLGQEYIHAELYVGNGYTLAAWMNGVHLVKYPASTKSKFDVFRHKDPVAAEAITKVIKDDFDRFMNHQPTKYLNKPYDWASLVYNSVAEILGKIKGEQQVQSQINYENKDAFMCSELVSRIYRDAGYPIVPEEPSAEWVSPSDLAHSSKLFKYI